MTEPLIEPTAQDVAALRAQHALTAVEFGRLAHVSAATVYAWETGRRACPLQPWELLQIYFGKTRPRIHYASAPRNEVKRLQYDLEMAHSETKRLRNIIAKTIIHLTDATS